MRGACGVHDENRPNSRVRVADQETIPKDNTQPKGAFHSGIVEPREASALHAPPACRPRRERQEEWRGKARKEIASLNSCCKEAKVQLMIFLQPSWAHSHFAVHQRNSLWDRS